MSETRATYEAPALTRVGSFEDLTQATGGGAKLDASFPTDTPKGELTFS